MRSIKLRRAVCLSLGLPMVIPAIVQSQEDGGRQIEEVVVTAERKESTVQDTSISITAFTSEFIEDFGIRDQEMLQNMIPSTTIQPFDVTIRGIGRNFRTLGGDPGVATYLNGVYSEDFGIASTENALYDVERVEVLRGPQGTLYGRNAIGGAINFINKRPSQETEGELRTQAGRFGQFELYGIFSGPLVKDVLAGRLVATRLFRDGDQDNVGTGKSEINEINDRNLAGSLLWTPNEKFSLWGRYNDRHSRRDVGSGSFLRDGPIEGSHLRDLEHEVFGLRQVDPNVTPFDFSSTNWWSQTVDPSEPILTLTNPVTGEAVQAQYARPGIDPAASTRLNPAFGHFQPPSIGNPDYTDISRDADVNGDVHDEEFDQNAVTLEATYDVNDEVTLKYIYGWNDFVYRLEFDADQTSSTVSAFDWQTIEDVTSESHEFQIFWNPTANISVTSGVYYFESDRNQFLDFSDQQNEGRFVNPTVDPTGTIPALLAAIGIGTTPVSLGSAPEGTSINGPWAGDPNGTFFTYNNNNQTEAIAVYSQMEWAFNDEFELTAGIRWSEDEKSADEDRFGYFEVGAFPFIPDLAFLPALAQLNIATGRLALADPTNPLSGLVRTGAGPLFLQGLPIGFADNLKLEDS
ncbi:MAG: TonB-dependent receptor plug domain-containing protein, partial [Pseudomonadota bacterium]